MKKLKKIQKLSLQEKLKKKLHFLNGIFYKRLKNSTTPTPAGTITKEGYVSVYFNHKNYKGHKLSWLWHFGEIPEEKIFFKNKDRSDINIKNLYTKNKDGDEAICIDYPNIEIALGVPKRDFTKEIPLDEISEGKWDNQLCYTIVDSEVIKCKILKNKDKRIYYSKSYLQEVNKHNAEIPYKKVIQIRDKRGNDIIRVFGNLKLAEENL